MFQAKKWNWKRVAAKLLLVPVLAGGAVVAVSNAQPGRGGNAGMPAMVQPPAARPTGGLPAHTGTDPKQLLKEGRRALAAGRYNEAQDLAQKAESYNPGGKWGLFDDTPNSLRKDVQSAVAKAHKGQADQLTKQARATAAKPAANDGERAYNLDMALKMAREAEKLHGPYSAWDLTDRADKLVKELVIARSKLKVASTPAYPNATAGTQPNRPFASTLPPAGNRPMPGTDGKKAAAVRLMSEAKTLADRGQFAAAKGKYIEADRLGATFTPGEYTPGFGLQELNTRGAAALDRLVRDAQAYTTQKDFAKADAALTAAGSIAKSLGLFPRPVTEAQAALWSASAGKYGTASPSGIAGVGGPEYLVPAGGVGGTAPTVPTGTQTVYGGNTGMPGTGTVTGRQLLDQAAYEFSKAEFDTAKKLATQAFNLGMQREAAGLLTSIDVEALKLKQRDAAKSFENARTAFADKDFKHAFRVLLLVEAKLLTDDARLARTQMMNACKVELDKAGPGANTGLMTASGTQSPSTVLPPPNDMMPGTTLPPGMTLPPGKANPPGTARVSPDSPTVQPDALRKVQFQKLRSEGIKAQVEAQAAFGRGETDLAMQLLIDYSNRVRAAGLTPSAVAMLLRPVDARLDQYRMMKGQADATARLNKDKRDARELITGRGVAEEERKREVAMLFRRYHELVKKSDFAGAEGVALQAKQLDPDDPAVGALYEMAKLQKAVKQAEKDKADKTAFTLEGLNDADRYGPIVTADKPVSVQLAALQRASLRGSDGSLYLKSKTPAEYDIELKLEKPISVEFRQTPLDQAIKNLQTLTGLPLLLDYKNLQQEGISEVQLLTFEPGTAMSAKNVLACILEQAGLNYVIENDAVKVTTTKKAKGRLFTKVFSVADLVTPVPNFALPDYANFNTMLNRNPLNSGNLVIGGLNAGGGATPYAPPGGLGEWPDSEHAGPTRHHARHPGRQSPNQPAGQFVQRGRRDQHQARATDPAHHQHGPAAHVGRPRRRG